MALGGANHRTNDVGESQNKYLSHEPRAFLSPLRAAETVRPTGPLSQHVIVAVIRHAWRPIGQPHFCDRAGHDEWVNAQ